MNELTDIYSATVELQSDYRNTVAEAKSFFLDTPSNYQSIAATLADDLKNAPHAIPELYKAAQNEILRLRAHRQILDCAADVLSGTTLEQALDAYDLPLDKTIPSAHILSVANRLQNGYEDQDDFITQYVPEAKELRRAARTIEAELPTEKEIDAAITEWRIKYLELAAKFIKSIDTAACDDEVFEYALNQLLEDGIDLEFLPDFAVAKALAPFGLNVRKAPAAKALVATYEDHIHGTKKAAAIVETNTRASRRRQLEKQAQSLMSMKGAEK